MRYIGHVSVSVSVRLSATYTLLELTQLMILNRKHSEVIDTFTN